MRILLIAGARPNFMKIAPLVHEIKRDALGIESKVVHTGQHYDYLMSKVFFEDLEIPEPDYFLGAGSGTHSEQTAKIMVEFESVCVAERPDVVVVVGDVNSTLACSIAAKKLNIKVAHVEAGLRSGDMTMPEEINRIVTDSISDYLFVSEWSGVENLTREGKDRARIFFVGNVMIDNLHYSLQKLAQTTVVTPHDAKYAVVTLHRPSNVDDERKLSEILGALSVISRQMHIYFPIHPRTEANVRRFNLGHFLADGSINVMPPMSYLSFLALWKEASLVFTDSGGLQEETTALGVPCLTIRDNTERPVTVEEGTNVLAGTTTGGILAAYERFKNGESKRGRVPVNWDGRAAERIIAALATVNSGRERLDSVGGPVRVSN